MYISKFDGDIQDILGLSPLRWKYESDYSKVLNIDMYLSCSDVQDMISIDRFSDLNILIMWRYMSILDDTNVNDIEWLGGRADLEKAHYMPNHDW